jgi:hypothetical protein
MDFRSKLATLDQRRPPAAAFSAASLVADPDALDEAPPPALNERAQVLADLRRKIAALTGAPPPRPVRAEPHRTTLPFVREEGERGVLYRRLERLPRSHHVGRIPVDAALGASSEILALLALDPALSGCSFRRALFLDTETTGLGAGAGVVPFLVGLCWFDADGRTVLEQLLLRSPADEPALLARLSQCVNDCEVLVTYNGKSFDWPLVRTRAIMNRVPALAERPHLDLLHVARRLHRRRLGMCRLVHLESAVLGFGRGPDVEGADIAARYGHFLRTGDEASLSAVVEHNAWDVVSMAALVGLYGEPVELLPPEDLVGLSRTLQRAGDLVFAERVADVAVERGGGGGARRARGEIAKARGDRNRALVEFEAAALALDDPALRLELAKLYEHFMKEPARALACVLAGTGEDEDALDRRRARLMRKAERAARKPERAARKAKKPRSSPASE